MTNKYWWVTPFFVTIIIAPVTELIPMLGMIVSLPFAIVLELLRGILPFPSNNVSIFFYLISFIISEIILGLIVVLFFWLLKNKSKNIRWSSKTFLITFIFASIFYLFYMFFATSEYLLLNFPVMISWQLLSTTGMIYKFCEGISCIPFVAVISGSIWGIIIVLLFLFILFCLRTIKKPAL